VSIASSAPYLLDAGAAEAYSRGIESPPRRRPVRNIHSDDTAARAAGFRAPIAAGEQTVALAAQFLAARFGDRFIRGGALEVTLTHPVFFGDTLVVKIENERDADGFSHLKIWVENQAHERVLEGFARARAA
jgi:acyl dehydratase